MLQGNLDAAESALDSDEEFRNTVELANDRAELLLARKDYARALDSLQLFFDGSNHGRVRIFSEYQESRIWYWFMLLQRGDSEKARLVERDIVMDPTYVGKKYSFPHPYESSKIKLAQMYIFMAGFHAHKFNFLRSNRYLKLAKDVDPNVVIELGFKRIESFMKITSDEANAIELVERFPILDHLEYRMLTGRPIKFD